MECPILPQRCRELCHPTGSRGSLSTPPARLTWERERREITNHQEDTASAAAANTPGDRLYVDSKFQLGHLVHILVDGLAHLGHADQLPNLIVTQIVETLPGKVFLLDPPNDIIRQFLELSEGSHGLPPGKGTRRV